VLDVLYVEKTGVSRGNYLHTTPHGSGSHNRTPFDKKTSFVFS